MGKLKDTKTKSNNNRTEMTRGSSAQEQLEVQAALAALKGLDYERTESKIERKINNGAKIKAEQLVGIRHRIVAIKDVESKDYFNEETGEASRFLVITVWLPDGSTPTYTTGATGIRRQLTDPITNEIFQVDPRDPSTFIRVSGGLSAKPAKNQKGQTFTAYWLVDNDLPATMSRNNNGQRAHA